MHWLCLAVLNQGFVVGGFGDLGGLRVWGVYGDERGFWL